MSPAEQLKLSTAQWEQLTDEQRAALVEHQKRFAAETASWAISEGPAIYGFVLFFIFGDLTDLLLFIGIAAVGFIMYRPQAISRHGITLSA